MTCPLHDGVRRRNPDAASESRDTAEGVIPPIATAPCLEFMLSVSLFGVVADLRQPGNALIETRFSLGFRPISNRKRSSAKQTTLLRAQFPLPDFLMEKSEGPEFARQ